MTSAVRLKHYAAQQYVRGLAQAWRGPFLVDPSLWLLRDPEAEEKMLRDADIRGAVQQRRHMIAGPDWNLAPADETSARGELAVFVGTQLLDHIRKFTESRMLLARAFFSGQRFARIHWAPKVLTLGDGTPRTWRVPVRLEDLDKRTFRVVPENDGETIKAHYEEFDFAKSDYMPLAKRDAIDLINHVYEDEQGTTGHGTALREALGWIWWAKMHVFEESLTAVERFAQGITHAKIAGLKDADGVPNATLYKAWEDTVAKSKGRHVIVSDKDDEIDIKEGSGTGWEMLSDMRAEFRETTYRVVLGSTLPTTANEGGSYALGQVQENTTDNLIRLDRESMDETLSCSLMRALWFHNWPNMVELSLERDQPKFVTSNEKTDDPADVVERATKLNAMGVDLPRDQLLEKAGFRVPEPGEEVIKGQTAQAGLPFPGLGADPSFATPTLGLSEAAV